MAPVRSLDGGGSGRVAAIPVLFVEFPLPHGCGIRCFLERDGGTGRCFGRQQLLEERCIALLLRSGVRVEDRDSRRPGADVHTGSVGYPYGILLRHHVVRVVGVRRVAVLRRPVRQHRVRVPCSHRVGVRVLHPRSGNFLRVGRAGQHGVTLSVTLRLVRVGFTVRRLGLGHGALAVNFGHPGRPGRLLPFKARPTGGGLGCSSERLPPHLLQDVNTLVLGRVRSDGHIGVDSRSVSSRHVGVV
mmetsp:Transcript_18513/g.54887  ORF Transcript_18513/g.54887 Transcript_18513/m.54887 type:complete len:244 (-) Transcript_18513:254-985(-)